MTQELERAGDGPTVGAETLRYLGLNPNDLEARALVLVCQRYGLDPLLGHVAVIKVAGGPRVYITRDGMLEIAHRSGVLDGITVEEQRESENGYSATVSVWRKDMTHPFTYKGGCGADEPIATQGHGAEMALARAERRALCRAFSIPVDDVDTGDLPELDVEHRLLTPSDPHDSWHTCTCGERFPTAAAFHAHKTPEQTTVAYTQPARPRRRDDPPPEYYDSLPEARGGR